MDNSSLLYLSFLFLAGGEYTKGIKLEKEEASITSKERYFRELFF